MQMMNAKCGMMNAPRMRTFVEIMLALAIMMILAMGCDPQEAPQAGGTQAMPPAIMMQAQGAIAALQKSVAELQPIAKAINQTGVGISGQTADKFTKRLDTIEHGVKTLSGALATISAVPGPQQPFLGGAAGIAGGVAALLGALGTLVQTLRRRKAVKGMDAVIRAVNDLKGAGAAITAATPKAGVAELVESRYQATIGNRKAA